MCSRRCLVLNLSRCLPVCFWVAASLCSHVALFAETAAAPPAEHIEFFEKRVRPVLLQHCVICHGDQKQQGGLRVDSSAAMLKGNESGAAIVPGKPEDSRLIQVLKYSSDDIQMPPAGKLAEHEIAALTKWVELGAPWPVEQGSHAGASGLSAKDHWSFQPVVDPPVPAVKAIDRVQQPVDAFILSALEAQNLSLSEPADRATFIRRATFDLWGIPPQFEDVEAFVNDNSPDAVANLIDRLLDSPLYGQRWGRHWLDIARYADTKGYVFTEEPRYPYAYTYRDYVVDSLNQDKPYDRFVMEQIAADQLDLGDDQEALAALGFLTVGRRFLNRREDIIDDRIDVVTRGLMGLTVTCARCHDHKYDPVPTADYYSLYGVFASSVEPEELPIIGVPKSEAEYAKFQEELAKIQKELDDHRREILAKVHEQLRSNVAAYLLLIVDGKANNPDSPEKSQFKFEPRQPVVDRWRRFLSTRKGPDDRVFGPWNRLVNLPDAEFVAAVETWVADLQANSAMRDKFHPDVVTAFVEKPLKTKHDLAVLYGDLFATVYAEAMDYLKSNPETPSLPNANREELREILYLADGPTTLKLEEVERVFLRDERDKDRRIIRKIENLQATSPGAPPRAMVMHDKPNPEEPRIAIRGDVRRPGDRVPRQFLEVLAGKDRKPFQKGSGRLELAQAIASPENPLTARVLVNRVWQHHFGVGLSRTPGDLGIRGEAPTHPELLDYLTKRFVENGWSIKSLHRAIMNSATYQQASFDRPECRQVDPENRLYWQMPRKRLEFEALRDSWLAVSGRLDTSLSGRPFENVSDPNSWRRTIYALVNRNDLPGVFRSFDFADVDVSMAERPATTVPQQALFAMNAPFVIAQAQALAAAVAKEPDDGAKVTALFRRALSREPTSSEREQALRFVHESPQTEKKLSNWDKLAQALLLTNEFAFID